MGLPDCNETDGCFDFFYKGYEVSPDNNFVTLSFSIRTNCNNDLSYAAFELPTGATATATGTGKFNYKTSITNNPFPSLKFEVKGNVTYKNGVSDDFAYIMSKADFDKLTTIRIQAKAANSIGTVSFDKDCHIPECIVNRTVNWTSITYTGNGTTGTTTARDEPTNTALLQSISTPGGTIRVCITLPPSNGYSTYSLVSYSAPAERFNPRLAHLQEVFDYETVTFGPEGGTKCLEISIPDCFYQVDLIKGCIIPRLGPFETNPENFYSAQNRLLAFSLGGTKPCKPEEPELGKEGCTPGYWKQEHHFGNWAPVVPSGAEATEFFDVFTVCDPMGNCSYRGLDEDLTLLEALNLGGGGFNALARHAAAAYLNATSADVAYSISESDVIAGVVNAFWTGNTSYKDVLERANEMGCPLGRAEMNSSSSIQGLNMAAGNQLKSYPSPFTDKATIEFNLAKSEAYSVSLYDMKGSLIRELKAGTAKAGELTSVEVDATKLPEGLYMARLVTTSGAQTIKLMVRKP